MLPFLNSKLLIPDLKRHTELAPILATAPSLKSRSIRDRATVYRAPKGTKIAATLAGRGFCPLEFGLID